MQIGDKNNQLTCLSIINKKEGLFKCDCGREKIMKIYNVINNKSKTCGHMFIIPDISKEYLLRLIDKYKYNKDIAKYLGISPITLRKIYKKYNIDYDYYKNKHKENIGKTIHYMYIKSFDGNKYYLCDCIYCGSKDILIESYMLECGRIKSCKKCNPKNSREASGSWKGYKGISGKIFYTIKRNAQNRKILFELTIKDIWDIYISQNMICQVTKEPIDFDRANNNILKFGNGKASVDRIDNSLAYTKDNIWIVHYDFNIFKQDLCLTELINLSNLIINPLKDNNITNIINIPYWYVSLCRKNSEKRNIQFNINEIDIVNLYNHQNGKCFYTGIQLTYPTTVENKYKHNMSIDRIDSNYGYSIDNIVLCCKKINMMKSTFSTNRFRHLAKCTYDYFNSR